ncbi:MAG: DNA replication/repair protein RecF [Oceanococcaceae bacterium]
MHLHQLEVRDFRCFEQVQLEFVPGINLLRGDNGSGKTSLIEALHLLLQKRSFRTRRLSQTIRLGQDEALAVLKLEADGRAQRLATRIRRDQIASVWNEDNNPPRAQLLRTFPSVLLEPSQVHDIVESAEARRRWLDRGVFHVEHRFVEHWQHFQRALQQRNAAISRRQSDLDLWTAALLQKVDLIDGIRRSAFSQLEGAVLQVIQDLNWTVLNDLRLEYRPGWDEHMGLEAQLRGQADAERRMGFTLSGPHRADVRLRVPKGAVKDWLSRGAQKLLSTALYLGLLSLLRQHDKPGLLLWDDWQAEFSADTQARVLEYLKETQSQVVLSTPGTDWPSSAPAPAQVFHVKHSP